jgi:hypothetical protein
VRQFRRELQEWQNEANGLRRQLNEAGVPTGEFDRIMRDLRGLDTDQAFTDPRNLAALQQAMLERLKQFEFTLRKKAEGGDQPLSLSGSDEVPAEFRRSIEEYYRAIARGR